MVVRRSILTNKVITTIVILLAFLSIANGENFREIKVLNEDGSIYGTIRSSPDGTALILRWQGQEKQIGDCEDKPLQETGAEMEGLKAVVYERDCGATVDFATHIAIHGPKGTEIVAIFEGRPRVKISWSTNGLEINHSPLPKESIFRQLTGVSGITITYTIKGSATPPTSQETLDFSNFNYGATGRAAGLPLELLLRLAGWTQQASGLYRQEWGEWSGGPPYGDDPRGSEKIRGGVDYYEEHYGRKGREGGT